MHHSSTWLIHAHDIRLVVVAAFVCSLSAFTVVTILERACVAAKRPGAWLALAGTISGVGIWATHFIAMLAYDPGVPVGYDPALTFLSALAAGTITGLGWMVALRRGAFTMIVSGLLIAAGISTMHYIGMAALRLPAHIVWDKLNISMSVLVCALFSILAVREQRRGVAGVPWRPAAALILAICSLHFIGMSAAHVAAHQDMKLSETLIDRNGLFALVLAGSLLVVGVGFFIVLFDKVAERESATTRIAHLAYHDALTGLSNRSALEFYLSSAVERARSTNQSIAVICIDLDGFKAINDTLGHASGDELLRQVAARLQQIVRRNEYVARVGGDEFVIIQHGGIQPADSGAVADRIISALKEPFNISGALADIAASVGVALFPRDADSTDDLAKKADAALYRAKADGRGLARFYEPSIDTARQERHELGLSLGAAIRNDELRLLYQPIMNLAQGSVCGFEALLRWDHPTLGPIEPELFIAVAEERALIGDIGLWVLQRACANAATWHQPLMISVNFSPVQFLQEDLARDVALVLKRSGLDPSRLKIEVTENVLLSQPAQALCIFNDLKALGVRISLDDFGTGYSSLSYFRVFPFDQVKIDKSFVSEIDGISSKEIIRAVIELSRSLGISVVAEGVETVEQLEALRQLGCELAQGYLISPPQPLEHFSNILFRQSPNVRAA